jgi:hypothetical protein
MDGSERRFHVVVHHFASLLWALGAVEPTIVALSDLLTRVAGEQGVPAALDKART